MRIFFLAIALMGSMALATFLPATAHANSFQDAVKASYTGPENPLKTCLSWRAHKKNGQFIWDTLKLQLKPGCGGPYAVTLWTWYNGWDLNKPTKAMAKDLENRYDNPFVGAAVRRFQRRVEDGEFPELEHLLPQTRSAKTESNGCTGPGCNLEIPESLQHKPDIVCQHRQATEVIERFPASYGSCPTGFQRIN